MVNTVFLCLYDQNNDVFCKHYWIQSDVNRNDECTHYNKGDEFANEDTENIVMHIAEIINIIKCLVVFICYCAVLGIFQIKTGIFTV